jgi:anaphase-promoting complex subunit 6
MCHLRGLLMLKLNRGEIAKQCFMEALALDVKCYDAFEQLISGEMMTPEEGLSLHALFSTRLSIESIEWQFIQGLSYPSQLCSTRYDSDSDEQVPTVPNSQTQSSPDAEFIRLIYTARLRKYDHLEEHRVVRTKLIEEVKFGQVCVIEHILRTIYSTDWMTIQTCSLVLQMPCTAPFNGLTALPSLIGRLAIPHSRYDILMF